jgi:hypothetical protein
MTARKCPNCAIFNTPDTAQCECGYNFIARRYPAAGRPPGVTPQRVGRFVIGSVALPIILLRLNFPVFDADGVSGLSLLAAVTIGAANLRACRFGLWSSGLAIMAYCVAAFPILFYVGVGISCGVYKNCP